MNSDDKRELGIHWSVTLQESSKLVQSWLMARPIAEDGTAANPSIEEIADALVTVAKKAWDWRSSIVMEDASEDVPYEASPPTDLPPGPTVAAPSIPSAPATENPAASRPQTCQCGAAMPFNPSPAGTDRSDAWFCPRKRKTRVPAEQEEQSRLHPPIWVDKEGNPIL